MENNKIYFIEFGQVIQLPPIILDLKELERMCLEPNGIDIDKKEYDTLKKMVEAINATDDWHAELII